jgi:hypothetical protein
MTLMVFSGGGDIPCRRARSMAFGDVGRLVQSRPGGPLVAEQADPEA